MHEVTIEVRFTTGTSVSNPEEAKRIVRRLLLEKLQEAEIAEVRSDGPSLFRVQVLKVSSEPLIHK